jgi:hypothetical protein
MENNKLKEFENQDYFGKKWILAPGGRKIVDTSQTRIWELHSEINAIGALFRNMQNSDISADEFYGISLCFLRIGRRLEKISNCLAKAIKEIP